VRPHVAAAVLLWTLGAGCGGSSEPQSAPQPPPGASTAPSTTETTPPPPAAEPEPKALPGLPKFTAGYRQWTKLHRGSLPPRPAGDAHLGTKRVFATKTRRPDGRFPYGTIVVKEAARPGADFIGLIAIMRKERGFDPEHNDWDFVEYTRNGPRERFAVTARDAVCWTCHAGAEQTDYLWIYTQGLAR
jgi:hypothetical protein